VFNVTGGELVIILLVALIVLGPDKLPDAIRKVGRVYGELRRMSTGFQSEIRDALDEPMREVRDTMNTMKGGFVTESESQTPPNPADPPAGTRLAGPDDSGPGPGASGGTGAEAEVPPSPSMETLDELAASPLEPSPPNGHGPHHDEPAPAPSPPAAMENERT